MGQKTSTLVTCPECHSRARVMAQTNGRLYFNCKDGCKAHHRFDPDAGENDIPAVFQPATDEPAPQPAPAEPEGAPNDQANGGEHGRDSFARLPWL